MASPPNSTAALGRPSVQDTIRRALTESVAMTTPKCCVCSSVFTRSWSTRSGWFFWLPGQRVKAEMEVLAVGVEDDAVSDGEVVVSLAGGVLIRPGSAGIR